MLHKYMGYVSKDRFLPEFMVRRYKWIHDQKNYLQQLQLAKHKRYRVKQALQRSYVHVRPDVLLFTHLDCGYR